MRSQSVVIYSLPITFLKKLTSVMIKQTQFLKNLQRFKLVTFDITDTLLKFKIPPEIQYAKTAATVGVNIDPQHLSQCFRQEFKTMAKLHPNFGCSSSNMNWQQWWIQLVYNIFRCADNTIPANKLDLIANTLFTEYRTQKCWEKVEGSTELVKRIKDAGKVVGVISNSDPSLRQVLEAMNMHEFDFVLTSYECKVQKPNPEIFNIPLNQCNVSPDEALHIGDLYDVDYLGARMSGWSSLLISNKTKTSDDHHTHVFQSLKDMLGALETHDIKW